MALSFWGNAGGSGQLCAHGAEGKHGNRFLNQGPNPTVMQCSLGR